MQIVYARATVFAMRSSTAQVIAAVVATSILHSQVVDRPSGAKQLAVVVDLKSAPAGLREAIVVLSARAVPESLWVRRKLSPAECLRLSSKILSDSVRVRRTAWDSLLVKANPYTSPNRLCSSDSVRVPPVFANENGAANLFSPRVLVSPLLAFRVFGSVNETPRSVKSESLSVVARVPYGATPPLKQFTTDSSFRFIALPLYGPGLSASLRKRLLEAPGSSTVELHSQLTKVLLLNNAQQAIVLSRRALTGGVLSSLNFSDCTNEAQAIRSSPYFSIVQSNTIALKQDSLAVWLQRANARHLIIVDWGHSASPTSHAALVRRSADDILKTFGVSEIDTSILTWNVSPWALGAKKVMDAIDRILSPSVTPNKQLRQQLSLGLPNARAWVETLDKLPAGSTFYLDPLVFYAMLRRYGDMRDAVFNFSFSVPKEDLFVNKFDTDSIPLGFVAAGNDAGAFDRKRWPQYEALSVSSRLMNVGWSSGDGRVLGMWGGRPDGRDVPLASVGCVQIGDSSNSNVFRGSSIASPHVATVAWLALTVSGRGLEHVTAALRLATAAPIAANTPIGSQGVFDPSLALLLATTSGFVMDSSGVLSQGALVSISGKRSDGQRWQPKIGPAALSMLVNKPCSGDAGPLTRCFVYRKAGQDGVVEETMELDTLSVKLRMQNGSDRLFSDVRSVAWQ